MPRPYVVGTPTVAVSTTPNSTTVLTFTRPTDAQTGDFVVAEVRTSGSTSPTDFSSPGFERQGFAFKPSDPAGRVLGQFIHRIADIATDPSTYVFTKAVADGRSVGNMYLVRGVDPTNPVAGRSLGWTETGFVINTHAFSVDTDEPTLLVYAFANEVTSPNPSAPVSTPGTQINLVASPGADTVTRSVIWSGYEPIDSTSVAAKSVTWRNAAGASASAFVFRGLADPVDPIPGFRSVSQMLSRTGATWSHRGGSVNWPEMSEYAYDRSVLRGYGVLEFSAQRTSDGVWIGCHDASLNRTSQTTGLPNISAMTWAQVQTHMNSLNSAGTPRPYYRLDAFLDKFTPTHVVVVDPKDTIGTYDTEFLNLLDAHGGNEKAIVKFFGVGSGAAALADKATARGYQTWGYFYADDVTDGDLALYQSHWSILGMDYQAAQSAWDAILAYGKPVTAHIVPDQAGYNLAMSKGASFAQVSAPLSVEPVGPGKFQPWDGFYVGSDPVDAVYVGSDLVWP